MDAARRGSAFVMCVMDARALVYLNYYLSACYEYQMASWKRLLRGLWKMLWRFGKVCPRRRRLRKREALLARRTNSSLGANQFFIAIVLERERPNKSLVDKRVMLIIFRLRWINLSAILN
jgi:hypothetical protein